MEKTARETALEVLQACRKEGAWCDGALKRLLAQNRLEGREAALCTRIVYGVMQNRLLLDYYLAAYCSRDFEQLAPLLRDLLEIGAFQLLFLDKVPDSAAVNETVALCKKRGQIRPASLVNAVLRQLARNKGNLPPIRQADSVSTLSLRYSHPKWLVQAFLQRLGQEETEQLLSLHNQTAPLTIQVNTLQTTHQALQQELEQQGVQVESHPWLPNCLQLQNAGNPERLPAFLRGDFLIQDAAARAAAMAAGTKAGDLVIDVCAAPGGKSFALAMEMEGKGRIFSCDIHPHKLKLMENGAKRLGISCVETVLADGREFRDCWKEQAQLVFCDVPCSGLGIIRKKPDIRYKDPQLLEGLPEIQRSILENACRYVRPGGVLLYSTCTLLSRENEELTGAFLKEHKEFEKEPFTLPLGECAGDLTLWPQEHHCDGFYICKMRKK